MVFLQSRLTVLATVLIHGMPIGSKGSEKLEGVDLGVMVSQVVEYHITGCHLVFLTTTQHSQLFSGILRHMSVGLVSGVVVEAEREFSHDRVALDHLLQGLWGDTRTTCRGLILDVTASNNSNSVLRLLESSELWKLSETRVVAVGGRAGVEDVLLHHSLRNTAHALYLALHDVTLYSSPHLGKVFPKRATVGERVWVYRRCLYCNNGEADVQLVLQENFSSLAQRAESLFAEQFQNFMGHRFQTVTVSYFPYIAYRKDSKDKGSTVTLTDSLDARLLLTLSSALNFTYELREEPERSWGRESDGMFSGMMGQLQREEADFCTMASMTAPRLRVMKHARAYDSDILTLLSLKPKLLPEHLSLIRPFAGELWAALLASVMIWGVLMWALQRAWRWVAGGRNLKFTTSLLYGWGALLEQPPIVPSVNDSGRLLVGWWLVFCLVITTGFRSSLIAHLTVQGKSLPLDTFEDMVARPNWKWGIETWILRGVPYDYLSKHTHPVVKKVYKEMEIMDLKEGLQNVQEDGFTFISMKNHLTVAVASQYADSRGQTPFYISQRGVYALPDYGWGFRKGAPFYTRFSNLMARLENSGIMSYWTEDVISKHVKKNRVALDSQVLQAATDDRRQVVLGLHHLQGAFYLLFLGSGVAFLTLLGENLAQIVP